MERFKKGRLTVSETLSAAFTNKEPQVRDGDGDSYCSND